MATRMHTTLGVVHVTATPPGWANRVAGIRAIHKTQDWSDIGCTDIINPNGRAEMGRGRIRSVPMSPGSTRSPRPGRWSAASTPSTGRISTRSTLRNSPRLQRECANSLQSFPDIKWCGRPDLPSDKNVNGITEPFEHIKASPSFDVVLCERERGLPVDDTKGTLKTVVLELESAPGLEGQDIRTATRIDFSRAVVMSSAPSAPSTARKRLLPLVRFSSHRTSPSPVASISPPALAFGRFFELKGAQVGEETQALKETVKKNQVIVPRRLMNESPGRCWASELAILSPNNTGRPHVLKG